MKCTNCNLEIPDSARVCPHCNAAVRTDVVRCPECFTSLKSGTTVCTKCGCNLLEHADRDNNKNDTPEEKPTKKIFAVYALCIAAAVAVFILVAVIRMNYLGKKFAEYSTDGLPLCKENAETITEIAELTEKKVYSKQWLVQSDNLNSVENSRKDEIAHVKETRDTLNYDFNMMSKYAFGKNEKMAVDSLRRSYDEIYLYVIGKMGTYPGYYSGYEKLYEKFKADLTKLEKIAESKK